MIRHDLTVVICQPLGACQKYVGTIGLQARFNEWVIKPPHFGTTFELVGLRKKTWGNKARENALEQLEVWKAIVMRLVLAASLGAWIVALDSQILCSLDSQIPKFRFGRPSLFKLDLQESLPATGTVVPPTMGYLGRIWWDVELQQLQNPNLNMEKWWKMLCSILHQLYIIDIHGSCNIWLLILGIIAPPNPWLWTWVRRMHSKDGIGWAAHIFVALLRCCSYWTSGKCETLGRWPEGREPDTWPSRRLSLV